MFKTLIKWLAIRQTIKEIGALTDNKSYLENIRNIAKVYTFRLRGPFYAGILTYLEQGYSEIEALKITMESLQEIIKKDCAQ